MESWEKKYQQEKLNRLKANIKQALTHHYKEEVNFEIVLEIPILFQGWECDEENYIVYTSKGEHLYINSDHGGLFVDPDYEAHMESRLKAYKSSESGLEKAKKLLKKKA
jgi:hypothetical protein